MRFRFSFPSSPCRRFVFFSFPLRRLPLRGERGAERLGVMRREAKGLSVAQVVGGVGDEKRCESAFGSAWPLLSSSSFSVSFLSSPAFFHILRCSSCAFSALLASSSISITHRSSNSTLCGEVEESGRGRRGRGGVSHCPFHAFRSSLGSCVSQTSFALWECRHHPLPSSSVVVVVR